MTGKSSKQRVSVLPAACTYLRGGRKLFGKFRKRREDAEESLLIRERNVLYWVVSPDHKDVKGPYIEVPRKPLGWIVVGFKADIFGTILHREPYETFEGKHLDD